MTIINYIRYTVGAGIVTGLIAIAALPGCSNDVSREFEQYQNDMATKTAAEAAHRANLEARLLVLETKTAPLEGRVAVQEDNYKVLANLDKKVDDLISSLAKLNQSFEAYKTQASQHFIQQTQTGYDAFRKAFQEYQTVAGDQNKTENEALETNIDTLGKDLKKLLEDYQTENQADMANLQSRIAAISLKLDQLSTTTQPTTGQYPARNTADIYGAPAYFIGKTLLRDIVNWNLKSFQDVFGFIPSHWWDDNLDNGEVQGNRAVIIDKTGRLSNKARAIFYLRSGATTTINEIDYGKLLDLERSFFDVNDANVRRASHVTIIPPGSPAFNAP